MGKDYNLLPSGRVQSKDEYEKQWDEYVKKTEATHPGWKWEDGKGWVFRADVKQIEVTQETTMKRVPKNPKEKCDCGTDSAFEREMPIESHSQWCKKRS